MSILEINLKKESDLKDNFSQFLTPIQELKELYGEINTPFAFIFQMLSIIPTKYFKEPDYKWLDAGAGHGNFSICLFFLLYKHLKQRIPNNDERKTHIIENMIYMVEINDVNTTYLKKIFGEKANIVEENYLDWFPTLNNKSLFFDFIIGNPPYNFNGLKKVPTKSNVNKKEDGKTIWSMFILKNFSLLKENGKMNVLIPSIWMKPDKSKMYYEFLKYQIEKTHNLNASEMNKLFSLQVQTPACYFLLTKRENKGKIELFDKMKNKYISFILSSNIPLPLCFTSIVQKCLKVKNKYGGLCVIKTNLPPKNCKLSHIKNEIYTFPNISTTLLDKDKNPTLKINYSKEALVFSGESKLVMGHKMYGFPYLDKEGVYGISARDNYVIKNRSIEELELIGEFLSTEFILFLFECTRYRMRYLEKYVFEYLPDFSLIPEIDKMEKHKRKDYIYELFEIDDEERKYIENYFRVKYKFFI
jgi:hypothetical protein